MTYNCVCKCICAYLRVCVFVRNVVMIIFDTMLITIIYSFTTGTIFVHGIVDTNLFVSNANL